MFPAHDPVLIFAIVMTAVLIAPLLAEKMRLPGIVGLIFFGVILGPHAAHILDRDKTIDLLGTIGLLYIMFQAGLEINLEEVRRNKHHSILFGLLTFIIPLTVGTAAGFYILNMSLPASILLASMFSSHTLLTFPIISRMGLARKKSVTSAIGGTIITDTLAFVVLAVIIATHAGELNSMFWIRLISLSTVYTLTVVIFLPKLTSWFFRYYLSETGVEDYVFVLTAVFISAYFSHLIGLEPIIGAFLAGLTLNSMIPEKSILMGRIQFVGNSLFIPFFLISVGMLINPAVLFTSFDAMKVSVVMIVIAFFTKDAAARIFSKLAGYNSIDRGLIFGMSVNQAAATLAAVMVGYRVGIFDSDILTGTILMIITTCFAGSVITQHYARKMALSVKEYKDESETGEKLKRILIPLSNDSNLSNLLDLAFLIHPKSSNEPLFPIHIALEREDVEKKIIEGEALLSKAAFKISSAHRTVVPLNRIDTNITAAILKAVNDQRISKIIMGWHDSGHFARSFYETISEKVAKGSDRMVIVPKIVRPLSITKRLVLIIPAFLNRQDGFAETVSVLKEIASELSAEWVIVCEERTYSEVEKYFSDKKNTKIVKMKDWKRSLDQITGHIKPDDMIIQLLARRYSFAWHPVFQKMPMLLCASFPENNYITVYPYRRTDIPEEEKYDGDEKCTLCGEIFKLIPENCFYFGSELSDPLDILKNITDDHYPDNGVHIYGSLALSASTYPLELSDDAVLIHARTGLAEEYGIFIAVSKQGFAFSKLEHTHKILIIIISPEKESAQSHLNILSRVSRIVRSDNCISNLILSESYIQFRQKTESISGQCE